MIVQRTIKLNHIITALAAFEETIHSALNTIVGASRERILLEHSIYQRKSGLATRKISGPNRIPRTDHLAFILGRCNRMRCAATRQ